MPCLGKSDPDPDHLEATTTWLGQGGLDVNAVVAGFELRAQPERLITVLQRLAASAGATRRPGQADCHDVHCAARALFGEALGPRAMHIALAYGYNPVERREAITQPWSMPELDGVAEAFADLPASMFPLDEQAPRTLIHKHTHREVAAHGPQRHFSVAARAGEGVSGILIEQGWHHVGADERRAIIVHEIAHEFTRTRGRSINWTDIWAEAMRADAGGTPEGGFSFASGYAQNSIDEDFAESFTAYRYMAQTLRRRAPNRYALLRDWAFDGLEYNAATRCAPAQARSRTVQDRTLQTLATASLPPEDRAAISRGCRALMKYGGDRLANCAKRGVFIEAFKRIWRATPSDHPTASSSALNALMRNEAFIDRALASVPQAVRLRISRLAENAVATPA